MVAPAGAASEETARERVRAIIYVYAPSPCCRQITPSSDAQSQIARTIDLDQKSGPLEKLQRSSAIEVGGDLILWLGTLTEGPARRHQVLPYDRLAGVTGQPEDHFAPEGYGLLEVLCTAPRGERESNL